MSKDTDLRLGDMAAHLLDDDVVCEIFRRLEAEYISAWTQTAAEDQTGREKLYQSIRALEDFKLHLKIVADTGTFTRKQLEKLTTRE